MVVEEFCWKLAVRGDEDDKKVTILLSKRIDTSIGSCRANVEFSKQGRDSAHLLSRVSTGSGVWAPVGRFLNCGIKAHEPLLERTVCPWNSMAVGF